MVAASGAGSPGMETTSFGPATKAAVMKFQTANGISALGLVGPSTRAKLNSLCTGSTGGNTGGNTGGTTTSGTGLKVMLAATSPSGTVLVTGQGIGDLGEFAFTNPSSAPITVTGLTFNRIGVSNDQTINNVYLYNNATRLTDSAGISNSQFSFTNAGGLFTVQPGATYVVAVRADIASGTSGQQIGVSLTNVAASGSLNSATTFPINSGFQMISQATLATVDFNSTTLPSGSTSISPQAAYPIWQNTVNVSTNPVWLKSMRFTNLGSIDATAVTNLMLYVDGAQVGSTVISLGADRSVTFDLSANPLKLSTQSHVIKVLGDVVGGANRTIQLSLQRSSDAMIVDSQLNQPILPTVGTSLLME
jgi:peptidoglycan hydrolase-like protein with peptidoglycan-binding domain